MTQISLKFSPFLQPLVHCSRTHLVTCLIRFAVGQIACYTLSRLRSCLADKLDTVSILSQNLRSLPIFLCEYIYVGSAPLSLSSLPTLVCTSTEAALSYTLIHSKIALPQFMTWI